MASQHKTQRRDHDNDGSLPVGQKVPARQGMPVTKEECEMGHPLVDKV